jgi:hypothetical protein
VEVEGAGGGRHLVHEGPENEANTRGIGLDATACTAAAAAAAGTSHSPPSQSQQWCTQCSNLPGLSCLGSGFWMSRHQRRYIWHTECAAASMAAVHMPACPFCPHAVGSAARCALHRVHPHPCGQEQSLTFAQRRCRQPQPAQQSHLCRGEAGERGGG